MSAPLTARQRLERILGPDLLELLGEFIGACVSEILSRRDTERRWLSVAATAEHLGVTEKSVRHGIASGLIPYTRLGDRRILVDRRALDVGLDKRVRGNHPNG